MVLSDYIEDMPDYLVFIPRFKMWKSRKGNKMNLNWKIPAIICSVLLLVSMFGCGVSYKNQEVRLRSLIVNKQKDNESEFDNMWKKISQTAQIDEKARDTLKDIFVSHAEARNSSGSQDGSLMKWVQESVPQVNLATTQNLMNIVTGSRDSWTFRQKELLDYKREHDILLDSVPSGWFISVFGNSEHIEVKIITSTRSAEAMNTGKDDDVELFKK